MGVPPIEEALEATVLCPIQEYFRRHHSTIEEYITTRPIYQLCTEADIFQGENWLVRW